MNLPGFTADAAISASSQQYRMSPSFQMPVQALLQQSTEVCYDAECLNWCLDHSDYPETCYAGPGCRIPCGGHGGPPPDPEIL